MTKEDLMYSDYSIFDEKKSQIDKGRILSVEKGLSCPRCSEELEIIEHGDTKECFSCGLVLTRHGNRLTCVAF